MVISVITSSTISGEEDTLGGLDPILAFMGLLILVTPTLSGGEGL